jgi:large subunit ribosomal protein L4
MIALALRSALSDRAALDQVVVVDRFDYEAPKTKRALATLSALRPDGIDADDRVLVVVERDDVVAQRSFANLPEAQVLLASELNCYDVLRSDWVLFTDATVPGGTTVVAGPASPATGDEGTAASEEDGPEEPAAEAAPEDEAPEDEAPEDEAPEDHEDEAPEDEVSGEERE